MQSDREMIKCAIFSEFFENEEDALGRHYTSSYLFSAPQIFLKKITHHDHDDMYMWKKNQNFWNTFEHSNFNILISA